MSALHASGFTDELISVNRRLRTAFDARARALGLTLPRARLLLQLARREGGALQGELASLLEVEQPTMVRLIDGLEALGLVERQAVDGDRRARRIVLTEAARAQADAVLALAEDTRAAMVQGISEADLVAAMRVLRAVNRNLGDEA